MTTTGVDYTMRGDAGFPPSLNFRVFQQYPSTSACSLGNGRPPDFHCKSVATSSSGSVCSEGQDRF